MRPFRPGWRLFAGLWVLWVTALHAAPPPVPEEVRFPERMVFHAGNDSHWSEEDFDDSGWKAAAPTRSWHRQELGMPWRVGDQGWYRILFVMPPDTDSRSWAVSAGFVGNISELWLNGRKIGGHGSFRRPELTGQRTVHAAIPPPGLLRPGTNLLAVRVLNNAGEGGMLGGPAGVFEASTLLPELRRAELAREATRVGLAALCFGWALVPLVFRMVGDRGGIFAGSGLPAGLLGLNVLMHSQLVMASAAGPTRTALAVVTWFAAGGVYVALHGFARRLGRPSRLWFWWIVPAVILYVILPAADMQDMNWLMRVYCGFVAWVQVAITALCLSAQPERRMVSRATLAGSLLLTSGAVAVAALGIWPLTPFAAKWWDYSDIGILLFLGLLGGSLLRGHVLARKQESELGRRLVSAHSEQRRQLGRVVHDGVLQDVQYWRLKAESDATEPTTDTRESLRAVGGGLLAATRDLRMLAEDLQPLATRGTELRGALEQLAKLLRLRYSVNVSASVELRDDVPRAICETLYRIAQEAAGNACRHSGSQQVEITVRDDGKTASLDVVDTGRGFVPGTVPAGRLGLQFLQDHAAWMGGRFSVRSSPGGGTTVRVEVDRPFRMA